MFVKRGGVATGVFDDVGEEGEIGQVMGFVRDLYSPTLTQTFLNCFDMAAVDS